ncbi:nitronate monooxygenase [Paenibacillus donghaensis]|uniref:nitronate monooxygenase n=1 Tax=Paenibacillus donghaensis TaxID=414771 RepID=UPI0018831FD4|nr:nitronate monooxygenase [Paenibacillus donghaensis]MBE9917649.1 nitronate monooxygenase [Paenibacillus donghaensis]
MLDTLKYPIIQAPMAGGISTPALAAAVSDAGGLGFLAGGYKTAEGLAEDIQELRQLTSSRFGVNIFVPGPSDADEDAIAAYRLKLEREAECLGTVLGNPSADDDDWNRKLDLVKAERVPFVSFTFGCPSKGIIQELQANGSLVIVTVTCVEEAKIAADAGADALCLQGIEAGGHRGTFSNGTDLQEEYGLLVLLRLVKQELGIPLIAAGGIMDGRAIAAVIAAGACAAQLGTSFLLCPESGTNPVYREALASPRFTSTRITRAFTGRRARGLVNDFMEAYDKEAPAAYPQLHHMTQGLRKTAAQNGNPEYMSLWAGQGYRLAQPLPAGELVRNLTAQLLEQNCE